MLAVTRPWADANADTLTRFLRVLDAGARWARANPEAAADALATAENSPREQAPGRIAALAVPPALNLAGLQSVLDLRTQFGYRLPLGDDLARYVDPRYLRAALGS